MGLDYPEDLLAREPAPPYEGEGAFALWHFSEDPSLGRFQPRTPPAQPGAQPLVRAVDTRHAPMFWFPRDCPRGCIWPVSGTTPEDRERFFGQSAANRVHVIEAGWLERVQAGSLHAYRLPADAFRPHEVGGYWVAEEPVEAIGHVVVDDLLGQHAAAGSPPWTAASSVTARSSGLMLAGSVQGPQSVADSSGGEVGTSLVADDDIGLVADDGLHQLVLTGEVMG